MPFIRVAGAQIDLTVGDLEGNRDRILAAMSWAESEGADILLLPELAVTGYPPEDLLLRDDFLDANLAVLDGLAAAAERMVTVVGFADRVEARPGAGFDDSVPRAVANAAGLIHDGQLRGVYHKMLLPNYGVFDEDRYFVPGSQATPVWGVGETLVGVSVCEDIWVQDGPPAHQAAAGARVLLNINASPYHYGKGRWRAGLLADQARASSVPVVYVNQVGGQDELVFDGESMVFDAAGDLLYRAPQFEEHLFWVDLEVPAASSEHSLAVCERPLRTTEPTALQPPAERLGDDAEIYSALVAGLRDYVRKNRFPGVVIGLSGGIDSAVTAAVAVDALGPEAVWTVAMPSRNNSPQSLDDAREVAARLGCRFDVIPIDPLFDAHLAALAQTFEGTAPGVAEENLQARIRGALLMALSNKFGPMVLTTGNKSEMAVGYATLYGDMAGGFSVLKDVFKTTVYRLARWRNRDEEVIPRPVLDKPPSAELRPDQKDTDSLPPYEVLDQVLERYVERDQSVDEIVAEGFEPAVTGRVARMVDTNEYKRRQAPPGVKITTKAFGKDRRLPITNGYQPESSRV